MCALCDILGLVDFDYLEVSASALKNSSVEAFGMVAQTPPAMVAFTSTGHRMSPWFYN